MVVCGARAGFVKIHTKKGKDVILGATIVAPDAGNLISEITVAMKAGMGLGALSAVIHPYPTQARRLALFDGARGLPSATTDCTQRSMSVVCMYAMASARSACCGCLFTTVPATTTEL